MKMIVTVLVASLLIACAGTGDPAIATSDNLIAAEPVNVIQPKYPSKAKKKGLEGKVVFKFDVAAKGFPYNIKVLQSEPKGVFDYQATKALKRWTFKPEMVNGDAVYSPNRTYTMEFKLDQKIAKK